MIKNIKNGPIIFTPHYSTTPFLGVDLYGNVYNENIYISVI